jgi:hypothetical protein
MFPAGKSPPWSFGSAAVGSAGWSPAGWCFGSTEAPVGAPGGTFGFWLTVGPEAGAAAPGGCTPAPWGACAPAFAWLAGACGTPPSQFQPT